MDMVAASSAGSRTAKIVGPLLPSTLVCLSVAAPRGDGHVDGCQWC